MLTLGFADGRDMGPVAGKEKVRDFFSRTKLSCSKGPALKGPEDPMSSGSWKHLAKVIRHLVELSREHIGRDGEVLWCQPHGSSVCNFSYVRAFWHYHEEHAHWKGILSAPQAQVCQGDPSHSS